MATGSKSKVAAGILAILFGHLGVHKFYLGYTSEGLIMLGISLVSLFVTGGIGNAVIAIIALVEGILYLTKSDEEFEQTYVLNKKAWF